MSKGSVQMNGIEYNNNVHFNAIILAGWVGNFWFNLLLPFFFDHTHPLFSRHIPSPSLHTLLTISLGGPSILQHLNFHNLTITSHIWEWFLYAWHDDTTTDSFELYHLRSLQQHPSYHGEYQSTPCQPPPYQLYHLTHIILIIQHSTPC